MAYFILCDVCGAAADRDASIKVCEDVASLVICSTCRVGNPEAQKKLERFNCPNTLNLAHIHRLQVELGTQIAALIANFELLTGRWVESLTVGHLVKDVKPGRTADFHSWKNAYSEIIGVGEVSVSLMDEPLPPPKEEEAF